MRAFAAARFQPRIVEAMQRPILEPPKWFEYAPRFLSQARIDGGVLYWNAHARDLARAEERFGVPAEIIVAIIGVETYYGRNTGTHRALDALSTLAFDYPRRATFFRGELREFLLLVREQRVDPLVPKGSFAGALGVPQFMPGSYREFAVDFDGDGRIDLWTSAPDIIGSVGNYLARHDWQRGQPVLLPAITRTVCGRATPPRRRDQRPLRGIVVSRWRRSDGNNPTLHRSRGVVMLRKDSEGVENKSYRLLHVLTRYNRALRDQYTSGRHSMAPRP